MYPTQVLPAHYRWKNDTPASRIVLYIGFGSDEPISIPMYGHPESTEPMRPAGTIMGAPHFGEAEETYVKLGGQAGILNGAAQFANEFQERQKRT